ncbi:MAG: adenosylcobinamide-phosphate synthase CbiB [Nitrospinota bacterium]
MTPLWIIVVVGYGADLLFGDPAWFPHPVRIIGWFITIMELPLRRNIKNEKISGACLTIIVVTFVWLLVYLITMFTSAINSSLGFLCSAYFIYTSVSTKDLGVEAMRVYNALESGDTNLARKNLGMIVGRDTDNLEHDEILRATVETVAENIVDGIVAPLFYAFLGGAPLALAYKAINTLDSMVGYKNDEYRDFGYISAKTDDFANFVPARLVALFLPLASFIAGRGGFDSLKIILRDRKRHPSPNSGIAEAAMAGALGVQLGGLNYYKGNPCPKPFIGDRVEPLSSIHILDAIKISNITSLIFLLSGVATMLII